MAIRGKNTQLCTLESLCEMTTTSFKLEKPSTCYFQTHIFCRGQDSIWYGGQGQGIMSPRGENWN